MLQTGGSTDVFVAGGGPAGLAAALAARRKGFRVTVADGSRPPIDKACGEGLLPSGLDALRQLGISLPLSKAFPLPGVRFVGSDCGTAADFPSACGWGIRRTALHEILVERAARDGITLLWGARVTGLDPGGILVGGRLIRARWIIGADGRGSLVRRWAGLDRYRFLRRRFGFRRHYRAAPWTEHVEVYWAAGCQIYVTRVSEDEFCLAVISSDPHLRVESSVLRVPALAARLRGAQPCSAERGAISASYELKRVFRGRVALVGDASGGVDAITGDGLALAFQQAVALASALETGGDLARYQTVHRQIARGPLRMASLMLVLDRHPALQCRALRALASSPDLFLRLLARHVGERTASSVRRNELLALVAGMLRSA